MAEVTGKYGTVYDIDPARPVESIDAHLAALRKNNLAFHPDFDLLLDARWTALEPDCTCTGPKAYDCPHRTSHEQGRHGA